MVSKVPDKRDGGKAIVCRHCKNEQYIPSAFIGAGRMYCYSCENQIKLEDYKND
jgi:hypothetical protein